MKRIFTILTLIIMAQLAHAQYYVVGQDPADIKWRQINTNNFQLIYPAEFELKAQNLAYVLEKVYDYSGHTLQHQPRKISVLLHTKTVRSNGFAVWAPARVEMFTTPHQGIYPHNWLEQLAIHEFRHVVQIDKIDAELPSIFKILLGQQAAGIVIGAYLPFWFLEGDAVVTETALSNSGRGRLPSFAMELKAIAVERGNNPYTKAYLGSYRDHVPNYYQMGYQLVAGTRAKYGPDVWSEAVRKAGRNPLSLNAFERGLKDKTGHSKASLYDEIFKGLLSKWRSEDEQKVLTPNTIISPIHKHYTSYRYPHFITDTTFFAVRSSISDVDRFVSIDSKGEEQILFTPGSFFEESLSFAHNKVYWIERKADIRWAHREFSLLRIFDIKTKMMREKRMEDKIYAPQISPDEEKIVAVKVNPLNHVTLVILSANTLEIEREIANPADWFFITPTFSADAKKIVAIALGQEGKAVMTYDLRTNQYKTLTPFSTNEIRKPVATTQKIYFSSAQNGTDNIYALDLDDLSIAQLTSSRFGIRDVQVSPSGEKVIYSDYAAAGFKVVTAEEDDFLWEKPTLRSSVNKIVTAISEDELGIIKAQKPDSILYKSMTYSKLGNLFNFHSWAPASIDADDNEIKPGFSVMSQDKLSTAITQLGYEYDLDNKVGKWFVDFEYAGQFPVFEIRSEYGKNKSSYLQVFVDEDENPVDTTLIGFSWREWTTTGSVKIPLNLSHGKWYRLLQPEVELGYTKYMHNSSTPSQFFSGNIIPVNYRIYFHNLHRQSLRDIQPRLGNIIDLNFRHTPIGNANFGSLWAAEGYQYLPGFFKHHGFTLYGAYQKKNPKTFAFSDEINLPRGYGRFSNTQLFTFRSDYVLPICYPDLNLGRLAYLKRLRLNLFYDYGWANTIALMNERAFNYKLSYTSIGGTLYSDGHLLQFKTPVTIGGRITHLLKNGNTTFEMVANINFDAL